MVNLSKYKVIFLAEVHARNDMPEDGEKIEQIKKIYREIVVPWRPTIILHELLDPRLKFTHDQFMQAVAKQERLSHYGQTGTEMFIDIEGILDSKADVAGFDDPNEVLFVEDLSKEATLKSNITREKTMLDILNTFYRQAGYTIVINVGMDHIVYDTCLRRFLNSREDVCVVLANGTIHDKLDTDVITGGRFDINTGTSYKDRLRAKTLNKKLKGEEFDLDIATEGYIDDMKKIFSKVKDSVISDWKNEDDPLGGKISAILTTGVGAAVMGATTLFYPPYALCKAIRHNKWAKDDHRDKKEFPDTHTIDFKFEEKIPVTPLLTLQYALHKIKSNAVEELQTDQGLANAMATILFGYKVDEKIDNSIQDMDEEEISKYSTIFDKGLEVDIANIEEILEDIEEKENQCKPYGIHIADGNKNYHIDDKAMEALYQVSTVKDTYHLPSELVDKYVDHIHKVVDAYNKMVDKLLAKAKPIEQKSSNESYTITEAISILNNKTPDQIQVSVEDDTNLISVLTNVSRFSPKSIIQKFFESEPTKPPTVSKYVTEENGKLYIQNCYIDRNTLSRYIGGESKQKAMFIKAGGFFSRTAEIPTFFKFEFIALLKEIKKNKYAHNVKELNAIYNELTNVNVAKLDKDIDRKHLEQVFHVTPLTHQDRVITKYLENKEVLGYRGMLMHAAAGSGKTLNSLMIAEGLHKEIEKVIVICPLPTLDKVWVDTLANGKYYKTTPSYYIVRNREEYKNEKYILCHYEGLSDLQKLLSKLKKFKTAVIIDEVHNLTVAKSNRTQLALDTVEQLNTDNVMLLSGTPIKSSIKEVIIILKFLDRSLDKANLEKRFYVLYSSPTEFMANLLRERYSTYTAIVEKKEIELKPLEVYDLKIDLPEKDLNKYKLSTIKQEMVSYVEQRFKEVKDNKDKIEQDYIRLRDKAYANKDNPVTAPDKVKYIKAVEKIKKCKPVMLYTIQEDVTYANQFEKMYILPYLKTDDKYNFKDVKSLYKYPILKIQGEALGNIVSGSRIACHVDLARNINYVNLQESTTKKVIYFSSYIEVCKAVEDGLKTAGYVPVGIYGESTKDLASLVTKFTNDKKVDALVTTYQSLSTGTPLIAANVIVCVDMPFRMHTYEQAIARAWRLGQDKNVSVYVVQIDTEEDTINSRNIDIITFFKNEVERITGVTYSTKLDIGTEEFDLLPNVSNEDIDIIPYVDQLKDNVDITTEASKGKRKVVEDLILKYVDRVVTGKTNTELYKQLFASMSDKQFDEFMQDLRDGKKTLSIIVPNGNSKYKVDINNNIKIAKELGFDFFQKLHVSADEDLPDYITSNKFLILKLPIRRVSQLLSKKISIPKDNKQIGILTGQVTGDDKSSKLSNPEVQILLGLGLDKSIQELMKIRGGDLGAKQAMDGMLTRYGVASQEQINEYETGVVSKNTLRSYFLAMHLRNTL